MGKKEDRIFVLNTNSNFKIEKGVYFLPNRENTETFENTYYNLRKLENRLYEDDIAINLPEYPKHGLFYDEWKIRAKNFEKLCKEIKKENASPKVILDVGCGNGWLSNQLHQEFPNSAIFAIDLNLEELEQAHRLFNSKNLYFLYGDMLSVPFSENSFDLILFGSSLQYFSELSSVLNRTRMLLKEDGTIFIFDTMFYTSQTINQAKKNSNNYYKSLDFPEMSNYYYHHSLEDIQSFKPDILFNPNSFRNKLLNRILKVTISPFYLLKLKKN